MIPRYRNTIGIFGKYVQNNSPLMLGLINYPIPNDTSQQVRSIKKHYDPKFRKERAKKFILPDYFKSLRARLDENAHYKRRGILPQREWKERPLFVASTLNIFEPYVVPEGDGKFSTIAKEVKRDNIQYITKKSKSYMALKKIRNYENEFTSKNFPQLALEIYKKAHEVLAAKDVDQLLQYVTETAYPLMMHNVMNKTLVWKFVESLEPPRIVHARVTSIVTKENYFAQVTVRFHNQQYLCIYDRFGRVLLGSETVKKDVLDYVVFEKHLSDTYGTWRVHGKIIPSWLQQNDTSTRTYVMPKAEEEEPEIPSSFAESIAETVPPTTVDEKPSGSAT